MSQMATSMEHRVFREHTLGAYIRGIERAIDVMHMRLEEPLTVDHLAEAAFMSRFHFNRAFRKVTGVSPGRFLAATRIEEAKRLLF